MEQYTPGLINQHVISKHTRTIKYSTWTDLCNKNCDRSSITDQFRVSSSIRQNGPLTGDRITEQSMHFTDLFCFLCHFDTYVRNVIGLNINLYFYFTCLLYKTGLTSFYIIKLRSDRLPVIGHRSVSDQSVNSHRSV